MLILNCQIIIEKEDGQNIVFRNVNSVTVTTSMDLLTDTCQIKLPRKYAKQKGGKDDLTTIFKKGKRVMVDLGYGNALDTVFEGYIKSFSYDYPIVVECENHAWLLKQQKTDKVFNPQKEQNITLCHIVDEYLCKEFLDNHELSLNIPDFNMGKYSIDANLSISKVFENIMGAFPLRFFFIDNVFHAVAFSEFKPANGAKKPIKFKSGYNVISDKLVYTEKKDAEVQIVVTAPGTKENEKVEAKYPTATCDTVQKQDLKIAVTKKEADDIAKRFYNAIATDKMSGSFKAFGKPFVKKGDVVHFIDEDNTERSGKNFLVKGVTYTFGKDGYRQDITLGNRIYE